MEKPQRFDWDLAEAFLYTAQEGSLSAAARKLEQTQPTLSRQVAALEEQLGVTLFERIGRRLEITETGRDLLEHVRSMGDAAHLVALGASGHSQAVAGTVRISAGEAVSAYLLPPIIDRLRARYPEIEIILVVSNQLSDLLRREADIAVRHVRPEQPDLVGRKVRESAAHLYAADQLLKRIGPPKTPEDLRGATFVGGGGDNQEFSRILEQIGAPVTIENFRVSADSHVVAWELVKQGIGIGGMIREIAELTPGVTQVLPCLPPIPVSYYLCTHRELRTSRRIRVVFDALAEELESGLFGRYPSAMRDLM